MEYGCWLEARKFGCLVLLEQLAATSADEGIQAYRQAVEFYADTLKIQDWDDILVGDIIMMRRSSPSARLF